MQSNTFIIILLIILAIFIIFDKKSEKFKSIHQNIYSNVGLIPNNYIMPPNSTQPNIDYQDYLNEVSGYDAGTRGYYNPIYAQDVATGLDTN
jgi:hypothetical protein